MLSEIRVTSRELRTVREAMRELNRIIDALGEGVLEKVVLTHRNEWRAVVLPISAYDALLQTMESCRAAGVTEQALAAEEPPALAPRARAA